jgi:hypothetical protein
MRHNLVPIPWSPDARATIPNLGVAPRHSALVMRKYPLLFFTFSETFYLLIPLDRARNPLLSASVAIHRKVLSLWIADRMCLYGKNAPWSDRVTSPNVPRNMQESWELTSKPLFLVVSSIGGGCLKNRRRDERARHSHYIFLIQRLVHKVIHRRWGVCIFMPDYSVMGWFWSPEMVATTT